MYMSVRKPPLSSTKNTSKSLALRKSDGTGVLDNNNNNNNNNNSPLGTMPSVPRTVPPRNYGRRNSGNHFIYSRTQRGRAPPYQTTNSLFAGSSVMQEKEHEPTLTTQHHQHQRGGSNNSNNNPVFVPGEEALAPRGNANANNDCFAGVGSRRVSRRTSMKRNSSDNIMALFGGMNHMNGERAGINNNNNNNITRKVFSGPPSTRVTANQTGGGGESLMQRPHPPGSGGPKLGGRPIQFAMNANNSSPSRPPRIFGQHKNSLESSMLSLRHGGRGGVASSTSPFALASVKLQQLSVPQRLPSPRFASEPPAAPARFGSLNGTVVGGGGGGNNNNNKAASSSIEDSANRGNTNLQYDFRVVASTGKGFNSPIKLTVGVGSLQGLRPTMEDEHFVRLNAATATGQPVSLLGILDGHCGRHVAELASKHVPDNFLSHSALGENNALAFVESIIQADRAVFHALGKDNGSGAGCNNNSNNNSGGGSTLIAAAVHGRMLYVACLGDARAVLYDGNTTIPMSEDHKPTTKKEHTRILQCGGFVQFGRVCGVLAVSRALGDYEFKFNGNRFIANRELMVSNVADVRQINLTDSSKFLLLACDGLWDVVENEEATQFVRDFLSYTPDVGSSPEATKRALNNCCQKLAEFAVDRGSTDNVSVMLLFFHDVADVVAGFDKPIGAVVTPPASQALSPRLGGPSRGISLGSFGSDGNIHLNGTAPGLRRPSFGTSSSFGGRGRSIW